MNWVFDTILVISACTGLLMILGGVVLIYKGAITLQATPKSDALTVRWRKQFLISTQVPAIGFFLIGLAFMVLPVWYGAPVADLPITVSGSVSGAQPPPITLVVRSESWDFARSSPFTATVYTTVHTLLVDVTAPGYQPITRSFGQDKWLRNRSIDLGTIDLTKTVSEGETNQAQIESIPFVTPPQSSEGTYGAIP